MIGQQEYTDAAMAKAYGRDNGSRSDSDTEMRDASADNRGRSSPFVDRGTRPDSPSVPGGFRQSTSTSSYSKVVTTTKTSSTRPACRTSSSSYSPSAPGGKLRAIYFYESTNPHYGFTNFSAHEVKFQGKVYPTSEHLFQALKVCQSAIQDKRFLIRVTWSSWSSGRGWRSTFERLGQVPGQLSTKRADSRPRYDRIGRM